MFKAQPTATTRNPTGSPPQNVQRPQSPAVTDSSPPPARPVKKPKRAAQSSSSSDDESKPQGSNSVRGGAARRGVRQPIKRGGTRF